MRKSGILMPIFSLPSKYGIGSFSKEAYEFVDNLEKSRQRLWQVLPLGPVDEFNSPYASSSTFAGNPLFVDLEGLINDGLLTKEECDEATKEDRKDETKVNYKAVKKSRQTLLRKAYERFKEKNDGGIYKFIEENSWWLDNYSLFAALKVHFKEKAWNEWDDPEIIARNEDALSKYNEELKDEVGYNKFVQYKFFTQWENLKKYANDKGIEIIGDLPMYVSMDSADVWAEKECFMLDGNFKPLSVAGCPPDAFCKDGQLWGNPIYNWQFIKDSGFGWWIRRFDLALKIYDCVRIDHFRGFDEYYSIPGSSNNAADGHWEKGPGMELFGMINQWFNNPSIIAEDLGLMTDSVKQLLKDSGYPGMKVLEFAFDESEASIFLPHFHEKNSVAYPGTHDNDLIIGWYKSLNKKIADYILEFAGLKSASYDEVNRLIIRMALGSCADTAIVQMGDYLKLGSEARLNEPGTTGKNWQWRMKKGAFNDKLCNEIARLVRLYNRG